MFGSEINSPPHSFLFLQASLQRVHRPVVPGPLATGKLAAAAHSWTGNPELFDPLQSNLARFRDSGTVRGRHGPAELSDRGYQGHGQNVPQQQPQQSLRQRHERRRQRWEAQKVTFPAHLRRGGQTPGPFFRTDPPTSTSPRPSPTHPI